MYGTMEPFCRQPKQSSNIPCIVQSKDQSGARLLETLEVGHELLVVHCRHVRLLLLLNLLDDDVIVVNGVLSLRLLTHEGRRVHGINRKFGGLKDTS